MGRAKHTQVAAPGEIQENDLAPEGIAEAPVTHGPFGKPTVIEFRKEEGGKGIPVEAMQAKPIEAGYIPPEERSNPEYLAGLATEKAHRDKMVKAFGYGVQAQVIGASPNSPQSKVLKVY